MPYHTTSFGNRHKLAKLGDELAISKWDEKVILMRKNVLLNDFWVGLGGEKDPLNCQIQDIAGF